MSRRFLLLTLIPFLCIPATLLSQDSDDSNRDRQTQRSGGQQFQMQSFVGQTMFFIDQVGLEFLNESVPNADYFDRSSYVIGPQDVLNINITGPVSINAQALVVNSSGILFIPYGGNVEVAGLTIEEAYREIESAVAGELVDFEISVHIQKPRPVQIQVVGDVPFPGRYILPAGTRLDVALYAALFEGELPTNNRNGARYQQQFLQNTNYSLRNIQIDRKWIDSSYRADLIDYFKTGNRDLNPYMYDGDQIRIRSVDENSPRVSISGAVESQQEFEFRPGDSIETLLSLSGGYLDGADTTRIILYAEDDSGTTRSTVELDQTNTADYILQRNDRIVVPYREDARRSASAWIYGEAQIPGNFPIENDKTTLAELIEFAGGLTSDALPNGAYMLRANMSDRGVPSATTLNTAQLMRTSDQVQQGFEYLEMEQDLNSDQRMFINLEDEERLSRIRITDGDRVYIPKDYQNVVLYGQLNNPGNYPFEQSQTVQDYINQAGGLSIAANPERIFVIKAGSRSWKQPGETTLESGDMIFVDRTPFDELNAQRNYDIQRRNLRQGNLQLILTTISTITAVVTTYVALRR